MLPQAPFLVIGLLSAPHRPAAPTLRLCSVSLANSGRQERGAAARKRLSGSFVDAPDEYEEPLKSAARAEWEAAADAAMKELDADFDAEAPSCLTNTHAHAHNTQACIHARVGALLERQTGAVERQAAALGGWVDAAGHYGQAPAGGAGAGKAHAQSAAAAVGSG